MAADRDLAVAFAIAWGTAPGRRRSGWDQQSATGVRALRLVAESQTFERFLLTDSHPEAVRVLAANARSAPGVTVQRWDARTPPSDPPFDYVDVDPYGSPLPFLPAAFGALAAEGVLAVTATDMMVLAGAQSAACYRLYGARPVRARLGSEGGLRILLAAIAREAARHDGGVDPLLAYVRGHHVRAYVRWRRGLRTPAPVGEIEPRAWAGPPLGGPGPFGPLWLGRLFEAELVERLQVPPSAQEPKEVGALLDRFRAEARVDVPFYYEPNALARQLKEARPVPLAEFERQIRAAGFGFARTHVRPEGFRTDAPRSVVESIAHAGPPT